MITKQLDDDIAEVLELLGELGVDAILSQPEALQAGVRHFIANLRMDDLKAFMEKERPEQAHVLEKLAAASRQLEAHVAESKAKLPLDTGIDRLGLRDFVKKTLRRNGLNTIGDILAFARVSHLYAMHGFGSASLRNVQIRLEVAGYKLP